MTTPANSEKKSSVSPGTVLAYLALGGLGIYLLLLFVGMGIEAFGDAKRRYPEVVMGFIFIGLVAAFAASGEKKKGGDDHH